MKKIFFIFVMCLISTSCGVKDDPEYKTKIDYVKIIHLG